MLSLAFEEVGPGAQKPMGVSGGSDGVVALWEREVEEGKGITKVGALVGHSQGVLDVAINEHYIVSWCVSLPLLFCRCFCLGALPTSSVLAF